MDLTVTDDYEQHDGILKVAHYKVYFSAFLGRTE